MGAVLIDQWLGAAERIAVFDDASVSLVREAIRARGATLPPLVVERMAAAASELARNQLAHAVSGVIGVHAIERAGVAGLEVIAADRGHGIADPAAALRGTPRAEGSLGVGLSAAARQADELDFDIRRGAGTCVRLRVFARPVKRSEVGILAVPHPSELVIGDHAVVLRDSELTIAVADGLGHGAPAREAADRAISYVQSHRAIEDVFAAAHAALPGTRGAVMSIARISDHGIEHAGIGNISARVIATDGMARHFGSTAGTLGSAFPRRLAVDRLPMAAGEVFVMYTDGLTSRVDLLHEPAVLRQHPIVIAQHLLARFGRGSDDALVAVVR